MMQITFQAAGCLRSRLGTGIRVGLFLSFRISSFRGQKYLVSAAMQRVGSGIQHLDKLRMAA